MNCMFCIIFRGSIYNLNFMFPKIMQNITKHLFILFILSLGYISASAQNITQNSYSVKDGLSNSTVKAICQDDKGYIWIGTKNGLNRLDGYEIKNYYHLPSKEVKQPNDIVSITQLSDGLFWIGTFSGIVLFDPMQEKFIDLQERYAGKEFPSSVVVGLHEDPKKNIWVATKQGLYVFKSDGTCSYVKDMRDTYIHMMAAASPYALLLDVVNQDYIWVARSKGMKKHKIITRHALRNALPPIVTVIGLQIGHILGGAVVIENIFSWPGVGGLLIDAINAKDTPMIEGCVLMIAFGYAVVNLLVDIVYAFLDPRLKYSGEDG